MTRFAIAACAAAIAITPALAQSNGGSAGPGEMLLHRQPNYNGEYYTIDANRRSVVTTDWPIRSIAIRAGEKWEICSMPRYRECIQLDRSVPDATRIGLNGNQIGSVRKVTGEAAAPAES
jgi:hypothetical protein